MKSLPLPLGREMRCIKYQSWGRQTISFNSYFPQRALKPDHFDTVISNFPTRYIHADATNYSTKIVMLQMFSIHLTNGKSEIAFSSRKQRHFQQSLTQTWKVSAVWSLHHKRNLFFFFNRIFFLLKMLYATFWIPEQVLWPQYQR